MNPFKINFVFDSCENNFSHSSKVAEWWGTWTSLAFFLVAIFGLTRPKTNNRLLMCYLATIPIGITSTIHHAILSPFTQFFDELAIIIGEVIYLRALYVDIEHTKLLTLLTLLGIYHPLPEAMVVFYLLGKILVQVNNMRKKFKKLRIYCNIIFGCAFVSLACLVLDLAALLGAPWLCLPYHSLWHIVMALFCFTGALAIEKLNKYYLN